MHVVAAFAHAPPVVWLIAAVALAGWWIDLQFHPFRPCVHCKGSGQNWGSRRTAYGLCKHGPRQVRLGGRKAAARQLRRL